MTNKLILSLFLLMSITIGYSQTKDQIKKIAAVEEKLWGAEAPYHDVFEIPQKWESESAVYIYRSVNYYYIRPQNSIEYTRVVRNRIKLLDQAAVNDYSEFKYKNNNAKQKHLYTFHLGLKVIKPNGEEHIVDVKEEKIEGEEETKLAIPNLEKGDIIDYYFYSDMIPGENDLYRFDEVEETVEATYPIMNYEFNLYTEKDFFISFNTYNGAPELQEQDVAEKKKRHYSFEMKDVDENTYPRWFYPYVELPCYKFQVNFARTRKNEKRAYAFIPEEDFDIKKTVTKEEVYTFYEDKLAPSGDIKQVRHFIKEHDFKSQTELVTAVFYFMRHKFYTNYIEAIVIEDAKIMNPFAYYMNAIFFNNDESFVRYFAQVLKDQKIDYEILVGTKRFNGSIDELLLEYNADFVLKVNTETPLYIDTFDAYATINKISPLLENSEAYSLKTTKKAVISEIAHAKLPASTYEENNSKEVANISFKDGFEGLVIDRNSYHIGHNKSDEQKSRLEYFDFVYEDYDKYNSTSVLEFAGKKKDRERHKTEYESLLKKLKEKQQENCKKLTSSEYDLKLDDYSFEVIKTGRFKTGDPLELKEHFTTEGDLIKKAGPSYILEVGKLIGGQFEVNEKTKERTQNVYSQNPRSYTNEVNITIPEGYEVSGIDKLNFNIDNITGAFESSASLDGNTLKIQTNKSYKNYFEPNSNWPLMLEFLVAANQFNEVKILFKKS
ncbi:DUF3857 domain-containing protein [Mangrovimonas sp. ST2L15]|uniref:DUF3857 domain-containing protein n=1 Tax=Mangrovimonas sp. ST2L15 TaxID=1645916 RepID=UPI0009E7BFC2|nr:DUF3857 domain-containing protein [Mangrovimonas sp. ST2L15]